MRRMLAPVRRGLCFLGMVGTASSPWGSSRRSPSRSMLALPQPTSRAAATNLGEQDGDAGTEVASARSQAAGSSLRRRQNLPGPLSPRFRPALTLLLKADLFDAER